MEGNKAVAQSRDHFVGRVHTYIHIIMTSCHVTFREGGKSVSHEKWSGHVTGYDVTTFEERERGKVCHMANGRVL
jgi:hypothetical protein